MSRIEQNSHMHMTRKIGFSRNNRGFSIVELLIAGTLGLILLGGVIQLFAGSNRNYTMQGEMASIQEDGRFALMFLERQFEKAGWVNNLSVADLNLPIIVERSSDGDNDSVTVSYYAEVNGVDDRDCNGAVVVNGRIENTFFINNDSLMCQGNGGGNAQPLISGVEKFQVLYGVETEAECPDGIVNNYQNLTEVIGSSLAGRIISVRVGFVLSSDTNVLQTAESKSFLVLDMPHTPEDPDTRLRRLFQQTFFMPNAAYRAISNPEQQLRCIANRAIN